MARALAWRRQWLGRYDALTAAYYEHASTRLANLASLLEWLRFRRELGFAVDKEYADSLLGWSASGGSDLAWQGAELLLESDLLPVADPEKARWLAPHAVGSPPVADYLRRSGVALAVREQRLAEIHAEQAQWRREFAAYLLANRGSICVVGNSGALVGMGLGRIIDANRSVFRFNRRSSAVATSADFGTELGVWVCTPKVLAEIAAQGGVAAPWVVISGPDMRFHRAGVPVDWDTVLAMRDAGTRVLTVPLEIWGGLVGQLGAPPSAGLLVLAWVGALLGGFAGIRVAGFDGAAGPAHAYHHAGRRHRPGRRHNWPGERAVFEQWRTAGLDVLTGRPTDLV